MVNSSMVYTCLFVYKGLTSLTTKDSSQNIKTEKQHNQVHGDGGDDSKIPACTSENSVFQQ